MGRFQWWVIRVSILGFALIVVPLAVIVTENIKPHIIEGSLPGVVIFFWLAIAIVIGLFCTVDHRCRGIFKRMT